MSFKIKYKDLSSFEFQNAIMKIAQTPTDGHTAYKLNKLTGKIEKARSKISEEYKGELLEKYAQKDAEGKFDPNKFVPAEETKAEFEKAQEDFGEREALIHNAPLTPNMIRDVKLSAREFEALGAAIDEEAFDKSTGAPQGIPQIPRIG